jgi:hypothetical protein
MSNKIVTEMNNSADIKSYLDELEETGVDLEASVDVIYAGDEELGVICEASSISDGNIVVNKNWEDELDLAYMAKGNHASAECSFRA